MLKKLRTNIDFKVEMTNVFRIENPDISMDEAEQQLISLGNTIFERDDKARTFKVADTEQYLEEEVWVCDYCSAYSKNKEKIIEHEKICKDKYINDKNLNN